MRKLGVEDQLTASLCHGFVWRGFGLFRGREGLCLLGGGFTFCFVSSEQMHSSQLELNINTLQIGTLSGLGYPWFSIASTVLTKSTSKIIHT